MVEFRLLGPVEVLIGGTAARLGGPRQRAVLAALLLHAGRDVRAERLLRLVWDDVPDSAASNLRTYLTRLRHVLHVPGEAQSRVTTRPGGYRIRVEPGELDVAAFERLARGAGADGLTEALALWRGPALDGLPLSAALRAEVARLDEMREAARERCCRARLAAGHHAEVIAEVRGLLAADPLRESLAELLMLALHRSGRQVEALQAFREIRARLVDEVGVEPGPALRHLHQQVLAADPVLELAEAPAPVVTHRTLPPDIAEFTGRDAELAAVLDQARHRPARAPVIAAVHGMGGIGKTRFAVHAAHGLVARGVGTDGQLYVDLRGFDPEHRPVDPAAALASFLGLLGVATDRIPATVESRVAMFRDRLAGRDVLLVLDNAAGESQVEPLLPGEPRCTVLVTSRRQLAVPGATSVALDAFSGTEARTLLTALVGADRITDDAGELVELCGRLPLAVALAAYRLRSRPAWRIADMAERLRDQDRRLDELAVRDRAVQAVLALSYAALTPEQQRLFRLAGVHPGSDLTAASGARLAGLDPSRTEDLLESLLDENLLLQATPGRYRMHDLLRAYAARLVPADEAEAARARLVDWYAASADAAIGLLYRRLVVLPIVTTSEPEHFADRAAGLRWLDAERPALVETAVHSALRWRDWRLCAAVRPYLHAAGHLADWQVVVETHAAAAEHVEDPWVRWDACRHSAIARRVAGDVEGGIALSAEALEMSRRQGFVAGEQAVLVDLGIALAQAGRLREAAEHYRGAIELAEAGGQQPIRLAAMGLLANTYFYMGQIEDAERCFGTNLAAEIEAGGNYQGSALVNLGGCNHLLGRYDRALEYCNRALHLNAGRQDGLSYTHCCLAEIHRDRGEFARAREHARIGLDLSREAGPTEREATALGVLGSVLRLDGEPERALELCTRAAAGAGERALHYERAVALLEVALALRDLGRTGPALDAVRQTREISAGRGFRAVEGRALTWQAQMERSSTLAAAALAIHRDTGHRLGEAHTLALLASLADDPGTAEGYRRGAHALYDAIGAPQPVRLQPIRYARPEYSAVQP